MKLIFASDSFKGSLSAVRIAQLLKAEAEVCFPGVETVSVPVADGGEGTVDALLLALGGERRTVRVTGPLGTPVNAVYGLTPGGIAVMEMAQASGLPLAQRRDPLHATSRGTGEMIAHALQAGCRKILLGIGGSATNDCGMGMLSALGARFPQENGQEAPDGGEGLSLVARADLSGLMPELRQAEITVICDVSNPLLGPTGATAVYGPQKGVTPDIYPALEMGMKHFANVLEVTLGRDISTMPGSGAAGGLGAALGGVLGATLKRGIDAVLDTVGFDALLEGADLIITGEGCMDEQSVSYGKVVSGIANRAETHHVPVCAIVGSMKPGAETFMDASAGHSVMTTVNAVMPLEHALRDAEALYRSAARRLFRLIAIGREIGK